MLAIGAIRAAEAEANVPERLSVGFDDIHFVLAPTLTTVSVPIHRLGYNTAQLLLDRANDTETNGRREDQCTVECHGIQKYQARAGVKRARWVVGSHTC